MEEKSTIIFRVREKLWISSLYNEESGLRKFNTHRKWWRHEGLRKVLQNLLTGLCKCLSEQGFEI